MKRPDYRTLQALDAVIRERGFERAAQKLCITQSAVSQRIKQLENMFGQPLLVRTVPPRPTEQGQKLLALLRQVELLEDEWLGDEQTGSTPLLLSLAVNADSLATWLLPALAPERVAGGWRASVQSSADCAPQHRARSVNTFTRRPAVAGLFISGCRADAGLEGGRPASARRGK